MNIDTFTKTYDETSYWKDCNISMKTEGNTTYINTRPDTTFRFKDINQYIEYKIYSIKFNFNENDTKSYNNSYSSNYSGNHNIVNYEKVLEPAEYQYVYHMIIQDSNYNNNQRATIKYHCNQFKKKHGIYKHISKNLLNKLHLTDNIINI